MMPPESADGRASQKAALARAAHAAHTDPAIGALLDRLEAAGGLPNDDAWAAANVREARRAFAKATAIPEDLAAQRAALESEGYGAWVSARQASDFSSFAPVLKKIVGMSRTVAGLLGPTLPSPPTDPYDALLDQFEKSCSASRLDELFGALKAGLVPLLAAVSELGTPPDTSILTAGAPFDTAAQARLCEDVAVALGFDKSRGRLDVSVHPFTGGPGGPSDVRMTTRFKEHEFVEGLTGATHETGHALYEQGRPASQTGLPAGEALSMGAHESQSLFWERHVGLTRPFAAWLAPRLAAAFPAAFPTPPDPDGLYRAMNVVKPPNERLIRVEADELTYPAHVILRYELERKLVSGALEADDLPGAWAALSKELLGVVPPSDAKGCLQDVHWPSGALGYFPTYVLGAAAAAQLDAALRADIPDVDGKIAAGEFGPLLAWLRERVHGRASGPATLDALLVEATGRPLSVGPLLEYLAKKYADVYALPPGVAEAAIAPGLEAAAKAGGSGKEAAKETATA
jgi:carboxypeptidase Taq